MDLDIIKFAGELLISHFIVFVLGGIVTLVLLRLRCPDCKRKGS